MTDMIERVARAIHAAMEYEEWYDWEAITAARAAIEATGVDHLLAELERLKGIEHIAKNLQDELNQIRQPPETGYLLWSPDAMADLMDSLAASADRHTNSYTETAHLCRQAAATIRRLAALPSPQVTEKKGYSINQTIEKNPE
jgi:hypothetical protein